jgi:hypothetical protein
MQNISVGAAIGEGFRLIRREPLALLAWSLVYFVFGVLPSIWLLTQMIPIYIALFSGDFDPTSPERRRTVPRSFPGSRRCWPRSCSPAPSFGRCCSRRIAGSSTCD